MNESGLSFSSTPSSKLVPRFARKSFHLRRSERNRQRTAVSSSLLAVQHSTDTRVRLRTRFVPRGHFHVPSRSEAPGKLVNPRACANDTNPALRQDLCFAQAGAMSERREDGEAGSRALSGLRMLGAMRLATRDHTGLYSCCAKWSIHMTGTATR